MLSVKESGIEHQIIKCEENWETVMFSMRNDAEFIAWVDADDIVYPGALTKSFELIENNNVGLVYTDECIINIDDKIVRISTSGEKTLWDLVSHPNCVHHLTVTRRGAISERVLPIYLKTGVPLDWAMRVDAACNMGMMHVPILGYGWRQHAKQITSGKNFNTKMKRIFQTVRNEFRMWASGINQI